MVEELPSGTAGGSAAAATQNLRALNTVIENGITGASLNVGSYQVTLPAGEYIFEYFCPAFRTNNHYALLYKASATAGVIGTGSNSYANSTDGYSTSSGTNVITLTTSTTLLELRNYTQTARAADGLGLAMSIAGRNERYSSLKIWKIA